MKNTETAQPLDTFLKLTVGGLKGGSGRSTTAVYLALAIARRTGQPVLLVDADAKNGTSYEWSEDAGDTWPSNVAVNYWPSNVLAKRIKDLRHEGHIIIDTGNDATILRQALRATDHLLIPMAPSGTESTRLTPTLEAAGEVAEDKDLRLSVLLSRTVANTNSRKEARQALKEAGIPVMDTEVPRREIYAQAFGTTPDELGAYDDVLTELIEGMTDHA